MSKASERSLHSIPAARSPRHGGDTVALFVAKTRAPWSSVCPFAVAAIAHSGGNRSGVCETSMRPGLLSSVPASSIEPSVWWIIDAPNPAR